MTVPPTGLHRSAPRFAATLTAEAGSIVLPAAVLTAEAGS